MALCWVGGTKTDAREDELCVKRVAAICSSEQDGVLLVHTCKLACKLCLQSKTSLR